MRVSTPLRADQNKSGGPQRPAALYLHFDAEQRLLRFRRHFAEELIGRTLRGAKDVQNSFAAYTNRSVRAVRILMTEFVRCRWTGRKTHVMRFE